MQNQNYKYIKDGKNFAYDKNHKRINTGDVIRVDSVKTLSVTKEMLDVLEPFIKGLNSIKHDYIEIV